MKFHYRLIVLSTALLLAGCGPSANRAVDYVAKAQEYYDAGDYVKARLEAENAAQVEPRNARARYLLALVAEQAKDYQKMLGHLLVAVDEDPVNVEARLKLGTLYTLAQAWEPAAAQAAAVLKLAPKDVRGHLLQARVFVQKGDEEAGRAAIATALKLDPDNLEAIQFQAAAEATKNLDRGLATLDAAIARFGPEKSRSLRELRLILLSQGKKTAELEQGLRALSRDFPEETSYRAALAQFYVTEGRAEEADTFLRSLTALDPSDSDKQLGYLRFLASQQDDARTEAAFRGFIEQNPDAATLRLSLGEFLEARQRPEEARVAYQALADRSPKSIEGLGARNRLAALEISAGRSGQALALIEKVLADAPDDATALRLRAGLRLANKKFGDAIADLRVVLRKEPGNERALLMLAQAYVDSSDFTLAKETYRRLLEADPKSGEGHRGLAALHTMANEYVDAEALLRKHLEMQPDDLVTAGRLVEVLMAGGQKERAEAEARSLAGRANQSGVGDFSLGRVLAQKNDFAGAAASFRKAVAARKDDPLPLEGLVRSLLAINKVDEAISVLNEQLADGHNQLFATFLLGDIHAAQGDVARAEKYLGEVLKEKPDSVDAWAALASVYRTDAEARIRVYERGLQARPGDTKLGMLLGLELEKAGRNDEAMVIYEQVLKASPDFAPAINNLAANLLDRRTDKASWVRALKLAKGLGTIDNAALLDTLGWAHYRVGEFPEAVAVLKRVVAKAGDVPEFRYHLGMAYFGAGNRKAAQEELRQAVEMPGASYSGLDDARRVLEKLRAAPPAGT